MVHFFKKKLDKTTKNIQKQLKPSRLSLRFRDPWVSTLVGLKDSSIWSFLCGIRRIFLLILAFSLAIDSFSLFSFASILLGVFWSYQGSRMDLFYLWLQRCLSGLLRMRGVKTWDFANVWIIIDALRSPQVRVHRDPSNIKGFTSRDVTVVPAYCGKFLYKSGLSLLNPQCVSSLLLILGYLLDSWVAFLAFRSSSWSSVTSCFSIAKFISL